MIPSLSHLFTGLACRALAQAGWGGIEVGTRPVSRLGYKSPRGSARAGGWVLTINCTSCPTVIMFRLNHQSKVSGVFEKGRQPHHPPQWSKQEGTWGWRTEEEEAAFLTPGQKWSCNMEHSSRKYVFLAYCVWDTINCFKNTSQAVATFNELRIL